MKVIVWIAAVVLLGALSVQLYHLYNGNLTARAELEKSSAELDKLKKENQQLQDNIIYYNEPENLAKELKAKFDYKKPGEKLIKIQ